MVSKGSTSSAIVLPVTVFTKICFFVLDWKLGSWSSGSNFLPNLVVSDVMLILVAVAIVSSMMRTAVEGVLVDMVVVVVGVEGVLVPMGMVKVLFLAVM